MMSTNTEKNPMGKAILMIEAFEKNFPDISKNVKDFLESQTKSIKEKKPIYDSLKSNFEKKKLQ